MIRTSRLAALALLCFHAERAAAAQSDARSLSRQEVEAWLASRGLNDTRKEASSGASADAPPPAPRHQGVAVEAGVGALAHVGALRHVSGVSPLFHLQLGYEPLRWLALFAEADLALGHTGRARPPPPPRAFALYGFGAGVRFTVAPWQRVGLFAQGSLGAARVSSDVLEVYGFEDADSFKAYFGGLLGAEWYAINPHYALSLAGGARLHPDGFEQDRGSESPIVVLGLASLRYTF